MTAIYLASQSARRQALLAQIGVDFKTLAIAIDETLLLDEAPRDAVMRLATAKAKVGWQHSDRVLDIPVLAGDTLVVCGDHILGKPDSREHAIDSLTQLSGRTHQVLTALTLHHGKRVRQQLSISHVTFRALSRDEINDYWQSGEPRDKAGAYAVQGRAARWITRIEGSYSGIVGLPLYECDQLLACARKYKG